MLPISTSSWESQDQLQEGATTVKWKEATDTPPQLFRSCPWVWDSVESIPSRERFGPTALC